jgi:class 3 adenylate cyclase
MTRESTLKKLDKALGDIFSDRSDIFIMFVDLCGSTAYKQKNTEFNWVLRQILFLQRAARLAEKRDGIVVKTIGDEIMVIFPASIVPGDILECAKEIALYFENLEIFRGSEKIEAKISIDFGPTINGSIVNTVPYDPIGTPVDRCARLNSITNNKEITFSEEFMSTLLFSSSEAALQEKYGYGKRLGDLKGIKENDVYFIKIE